MLPDNSNTPFQSDVVRYLASSTISKKSTREVNSCGDMEIELGEIDFVGIEENEEEREERGGARGGSKSEVARGSRRRTRASEGGVGSKTKSAAKRTRRTTTANHQSNDCNRKYG